MARPGGNPDLEKHRFKPATEESLTHLLQVKVSKRVKDAVRAQPDPSEFMRQAIQEKLDKLNS
jgi:hypothetical protein